MATVVITVTDGPGGVVVTCESKNPPIPMTPDGDPAMDETTPAQALSIGAIMYLSDQFGADFRTLLRD